MTSRWRPKNRRQILQLDDEGSQSPGGASSGAVPSSAVPAAPNKLHALLGHYNSDEDSDNEGKEDAEFKDFMKEIKSAEETPLPPTLAQPSVWQELWDPQSGQPYYWHTITNELTWEKPHDLTQPRPTVKPEVAKEVPMPSTVTTPKSSISAKIPPVGELKTVVPAREETSKISFRLSQQNPTNKNIEAAVQAKTNGRLTIDADDIIAAIEREVPPDHQQAFVPLFKRRPPSQLEAGKTRLGTDFKSYFPVQHQSVVANLLGEPASLPALESVTTSHRGLGYHVNSEEATKDDLQSTSQPTTEKVKFVAGEILTPMVVPPPPLTLSEKIQRLEECKQGLSVEWSAQLDVLKDAWRKKKLEPDYFEEWLDAKLDVLQKAESEKTKSSVTVDASPADGGEDQVIDMVLEDSGSEKSNTPVPPSESGIAVPPPEELDSALNSFYTDLAELDAAAAAAAVNPTEEHLPTPAAIQTVAEAAQPSTIPADQVGSPSTNEEEQLASNISSETLVRAVKRTKMSSDMTSLVAKWQKINQTGGGT